MCQSPYFEENGKVIHVHVVHGIWLKSELENDRKCHQSIAIGVHYNNYLRQSPYFEENGKVIVHGIVNFDD